MTEAAIPRAIRVDVKVVSFVRAFRLTYDRGPSLREIMLETRASSKTGVSRAVARLIAAGRLVRLADGLAIPGDLEAAAVLLQRAGWMIQAPAGEVERNGNYAPPDDMRHLLAKLG